MLRARLASLALAGSLLFGTGCSTSFDFLHTNRSRSLGCPMGGDCCEMSAPCCPGNGCMSGGFGAPLISNAHPPLVEGPSLFAPGPNPLVFPGGTMPPVSTAPRPAPLPPVVTIPQAAATPSPPH